MAHSIQRDSYSTAQRYGTGLGIAFEMIGSATRPAQVNKFQIVSSDATFWGVERRSTAAAGGASFTVTADEHDQRNNPPTASFLFFTAVPAGGVFVSSISQGASFGASESEVIYGEGQMQQPIILKGTSDILTLAVSVAITNLVVWIEWEEWTSA